MDKIIAIKNGNEVIFKKSGTGSKSTLINIAYKQFLEPLGITEEDNKISISLEEKNGEKKVVIRKKENDEKVE